MIESDDTYDLHQAELAEAIRKVTDTAVVTHYVVVAYAIESDGEETVSTAHSPGLPYWMALGLHQHAVDVYRPQPAWTINEL